MTAPQRSGPRKRPQQARSRATVEVIIEAAARILEQQGHDAFTTNAVAERAGVSIGSLYQYFPRKDALVGALILRETARLVVDAEAALQAPTGTAGLAVLIRAAVAHQLHRPVLGRLLDFEEARRPAEADTQPLKARLQAIAADVLSRPDLPRQPDDASAAADVLAIIRGMVDAAGERGETSQRPVVARVTRAVFGFLRTRLPAAPESRS